MKTAISQFRDEFPSVSQYWRSIILFGLNTASYKFALAESIMEIARESKKTEISLETLSEKFTSHIIRHIGEFPIQTTGKESAFLKKCREAADKKDLSEAVAEGMKTGFRYVLDAFHVVDNENLPVKFFIRESDGRSKKIILTDEIFRLLEDAEYQNLFKEAESRWNLVENAWESKISRNLLNIGYSGETESFVMERYLKRKTVTSARGALNGYQKGTCFYCYQPISIIEGSINMCDVDHFLPHVLKPYFAPVNPDGVWNLVLSCRECNRGINGKYGKIPHIKYLKRLHKRNEFLISSNHPLKETLINQTGNTEEKRTIFLNQVYDKSYGLKLSQWETQEKSAPLF